MKNKLMLVLVCSCLSILNLGAADVSAYRRLEAGDTALLEEGALFGYAFSSNQDVQELLDDAAILGPGQPAVVPERRQQYSIRDLGVVVNQFPEDHI